MPLVVCLAAFCPSASAYGDDSASSYTIDIPASVSIDPANQQARLSVNGSIAANKELDVSVSSENDFKLKCSGFSLPYSLSGSSLSEDSQGDGYEMSFDSTGDSSSGSSGAVAFSDELTVSLAKGFSPEVSGEYRDKLTFSYSCSSAQRLTLDANGGQVKGSLTYGLSKKVGVSYGSLPTPQWDGHVFEGWYTAASGGTLVASDDVMPDQAITLYAHWRACVLTINYWNDGAQEWRSYSSSSNVSVSENQLVEVEKVEYDGPYKHSRYGILDVSRFTRTGYKPYGSFNGFWRMGSKDSQVLVSGADWPSYSSGLDEAKGSYVAEFLGVLDSFKNMDVTVDLYPFFVANTYYVKYDGNGGDAGSMLGTTCSYDEPESLRSNAFRREGYEFVGWNTAKDGSGSSFADGASVKNLTSVNEATVTLYAQWRQLSGDSQQGDDDRDDSGQSYGVTTSDGADSGQDVDVDSSDVSVAEQGDACGQGNASDSQIEDADESDDLDLETWREAKAEFDADPAILTASEIAEKYL